MRPPASSTDINNVRVHAYRCWVPASRGGIPRLNKRANRVPPAMSVNQTMLMMMISKTSSRFVPRKATTTAREATAAVKLNRNSTG